MTRDPSIVHTSQPSFLKKLVTARAESEPWESTRVMSC